MLIRNLIAIQIYTLNLTLNMNTPKEDHLADKRGLLIRVLKLFQLTF